MVGTTISHYRILEKVGEGGMGVVYRAEDTRLHRIVALKFTAPEVLSQKSLRDRFLHEAQALATVNHPSVSHVYEANEFEGAPFIAMEFVEGTTLQELLETKRGDLLSFHEVLQYAEQIAEGLEAVHARGVIHRDIKSTNILVDSRGRLKIADFGLALIEGKTRVTREAAAPGTVAYMSPEQVQGIEVDQRTDIWSFGVLLYEMLSGRLPFSSHYDQAVIYGILNEQLPSLQSLRPGIPEGFLRIVERALAKNPEDRYPDFTRLLSDLRTLSVPTGKGSMPMIRSRKVSSSRRLIIPAIGAALLVIVGITWKALQHDTNQRIPDAIVVLPFKNLGDTASTYITAGLGEAISNEIGKIPDLTVIAHSSASHFVTGNTDPAKISSALGVRYILDGTVQRSSSALRVIARLLDAPSSRQLWSEKFEGTPDDLMKFQDDIAGKILVALKPALSPDEKTVLHLQPTANAKAYDLYLSGKFYLDKRTFAKTDTAIDLLQRAINFDPQFALAYAALGRAYSTKIFAGDRTQGLEEKASIAIEKALTLDPRLAEGYVARAVLLWTKMNGFPHERAIRELYKALSINPNLVEAHEWVGTILSHVGLLDKALDHYRQAIILDPTSTIAPPRVARVLWYEQRYAESLERFQEIPGTAWRDDRARVLQYLGRNDEAFAALMDTPAGIEEEPQRGDQPLSNPDLSGGLALLYAAKGDTTLAIRQIARLRQAEAFSSHFHHAEYTIACSYALMRKNAAALEWLRRAADDGLPCYPLFQSDPFLASLRSDPAYISMMERMKQQWEHFKDTL